MKKCKTCYLINAKPCYECSACASGDDHYKYWPNTQTNADRIRSMSDEELAKELTRNPAPVVRCKDCKHYNTIGCSKGFGWCENIDRGTSDNFYCAEAAVGMGAQDLRKEESEG